MPDPSTTPRFLILAQAGEELKCSVGQIYSLRSGDLQGIQIGGRKQWRVERAILEDYIAAAYRRTRANLDKLPADLSDDELRPDR